jgi:ABC-type polysaccharide/polyol phosphate export permease
MEATTAHRRIYDSASPGPLMVRDLREFWQRRGLLRLLVTRDLVLRYKRSLLGVWWTLLNPLLKMAVLWAVLAGAWIIARAHSPAGRR